MEDVVKKQLIFWKSLSIVLVIVVVGFLISGFVYENDTLKNPSVGNGVDVNSNPISLKITNEDIVYGNRNADVIIFEYSDLECPFCERIHVSLKEILSANPDVAWVYRHFPLTAIHPTAEAAAVISECLKEESSDFAKEYVDTLFSQFGAKGVEYYKDVAKSISGISDSDLNECLSLNSKQYRTVLNHLEQGQKFGIRGTPGGFVLNKSNDRIQKLEGAVPTSQIQLLINTVK